MGVEVFLLEIYRVFFFQGFLEVELDYCVDGLDKRVFGDGLVGAGVCRHCFVVCHCFFFDFRV